MSSASANPTAGVPVWNTFTCKFCIGQAISQSAWPSNNETVDAPRAANASICLRMRCLAKFDGYGALSEADDKAALSIAAREPQTAEVQGRSPRR
jgi:hypothetical protein